MSLLEFFSQPLCHRLALTLLHFLWQGLAVAVLASAAVWLLGLRRGNARYAAYLLAFALMTACPPVTWFALHQSAELGGVAVVPMPKAESVGSVPAEAPTPPSACAWGPPGGRSCPCELHAAGCSADVPAVAAGGLDERGSDLERSAAAWIHRCLPMAPGPGTSAAGAGAARRTAQRAAGPGRLFPCVRFTPRAGSGGVGLSAAGRLAAGRPVDADVPGDAGGDRGP